MLFNLRYLTDGCCKRRRVVNLAVASIPAAYLQKDLKSVLVLGQIGNIAEVSLNNMNPGATWMRGQQLEVTGAVKDGENKLVILVTNTLINIVSAMKEPPPVPKELISRFGSGSVSKETPREFGFKPLPSSEFIGPVQIIPAKEILARF